MVLCLKRPPLYHFRSVQKGRGGNTPKIIEAVTKKPGLPPSPPTSMTPTSATPRTLPTPSSAQPPQPPSFPRGLRQIDMISTREKYKGPLKALEIKNEAKKAKQTPLEKQAPSDHNPPENALGKFDPSHKVIPGTGIFPINSGLVAGFKVGTMGQQSQPTADVSKVPEVSAAPEPITDSLPDDGLSDFVQPPKPPQLPKPPQPRCPDETPKRTLTFSEEIKEKVEERGKRTGEIMTKLLALDKRGLLDIETSKVKAEFYAHLKKQRPTITASVELSEEQFLQNLNFHVGRLVPAEVEKNVLLSGMEMHAVILYTIKDDQTIVWGYLTSQKSEDVVLLSSTQPFMESGNENKPQYFRCVEPLIVSHDSVENLEEKQQDKGDKYVQRSDVLNILKQEFLTKTLPQLQQPIGVYDGIAITEEDIDSTLDYFDKTKIQDAYKLFKKYEHKLTYKSEEDAKDWLTKMKVQNKEAYPHLEKLIDEKYGK